MVSPSGVNRTPQRLLDFPVCRVPAYASGAALTSESVVEAKLDQLEAQGRSPNHTAVYGIKPTSGPISSQRGCGWATPYGQSKHSAPRL